MRWPKITKAWQIIGVVAAIVLLVYAAIHFLVVPKFTSWMTSKFPEAFAVKETIQEHYPDKNVGFTDQTVNNQDGKRRTLIISVAGESHLESNESETIKSLICSELGQTETYDGLVLQSFVEHGLLIFYSRTGESEPFGC
jgi:hypothetical protein